MNINRIRSYRSMPHSRWFGRKRKWRAWWGRPEQTSMLQEQSKRWQIDERKPFYSRDLKARSEWAEDRLTALWVWLKYVWAAEKSWTGFIPLHRIAPFATMPISRYWNARYTGSFLWENNEIKRLLLVTARGYAAALGSIGRETLAMAQNVSFE